MSMFEMFVSYSLLVAASLSLLTYWITRKFVLKKMNRTIMKAEHNYQQQIASLQQQLSGKVNIWKVWWKNCAFPTRNSTA